MTLLISYEDNILVININLKHQEDCTQKQYIKVWHPNCTRSLLRNTCFCLIKRSLYNRVRSVYEC